MQCEDENNNVASDTMVEEATESKVGHFAKIWSDFLLQKLHSYGEALNLRGAMAPLAPYFHRLCSDMIFLTIIYATWFMTGL